jgi:hypothetical protein
MKYRDITVNELELLERLLFFRLSEQMMSKHRGKKYLVKEIDKNGSLKFIHEGNLSQLAQRKFPVEAQSLDKDNIYIHALLFLVNDEIDELEFYKDDSSSILQMPKPQDWEIIEFS